MQVNPPRICVPICVHRTGEISVELRRAAEFADVIELRLDCLEESERDQARRLLPEWLDQFDGSVILTLRASDQGGHAAIDGEARESFWTSVGELPVSCLVDLELDLVQKLATEKPKRKLPFDWSAVICSHHDFTGVPVDLEQIYDRMAATPARILKIAVQANDATDCITVFRLLDRAQRDGRELIAIAMGEAGIATRILGPSRGSFLTYGSLDDASATAPGQCGVRELRGRYRIDGIKRETQIFGLMGRPVRHSISPQIHNAAFAAEKVDAVYLPFEVHDAGEFLRRLVRPDLRELDWNLRGLSVTAPHKTAVIASLDWIEPAAREIGAINTIVVEGNELRGYNTDALAFILPLRERLGSLKDARCAVIGAGGGARAALWALRNESARVELFVRDVTAARSLATEFGAGCNPLSAAGFNGFDLVINATPLGTAGKHQDETPATAEQLRNVRLAYDLVYNPLETRFLREALAAGCATLGGLEMLLAQAVEQFKLWTGQTPRVEVMKAAALEALGK